MSDQPGILETGLGTLAQLVEYLLNSRRLWTLARQDDSFWEIETGGSEVYNHPLLHSELSVTRLVWLTNLVCLEVSLEMLGMRMTSDSGIHLPLPPKC